ncbi:MAG: tetratricopeptide repeat protein [Thermodesulfovibrionales bacterium]
MNIHRALQFALEHFQAGDFEKAEALYRQILVTKPNNIDALHNLGILCYQRGDYDSAIRYINKVIQHMPNNAPAYNNMGLAYAGKGHHNEAIKFYRKAIHLDPIFSNAHYNLANVFKDKGDIDSAIADYQKALQLDPGLSYAYNNLGIAYKQKGDIDEAIKNFKKALSINPLLANAHYNLGLSVLKKGQLEEAMTCYQKALQLNPQFAVVYNDLGVAYQVKGDRDAAITCYKKAIGLNLNRPDVFNNIGLALQEKGQLEEAMSYYQKAIDLNPHFADAYINLGNVLKDFGKLDEAEANYRHVFQINPEHAIAYSNILFTMNYDCGYDAQTIFREHLNFAKKLAEPLSSIRLRHTNERDPYKKLRIGYVSPDFRKHSIAYFIEPVLSSHNREKYEIFCYSDVLFPDDVTKRIQEYTDQWRGIAGMTDDMVSESIRNDKIDILIDLAGHTAKNRLLLFARKPAPVQVSWIGYPSTTGLSAMDYKIVDHYTDPEGMTEKLYSEKLIRMPESFLCYLPYEESPDVGPLPALTNDWTTFGSFNNFSKVSTDILKVWSGILRELPRSRLMLKSQAFISKMVCNRVTDVFEKDGVSAERIEFMSFEPSIKMHLDLYNRIDIALDTFPYHGTTTTCEALWMGVPVITLAGNAHVSRVGVSLLSNVGLPELIASTSDEYIAKAVNLANAPDKLKTLRERLRQMMKNSPLTDQKRFAAYLEQIYHEIWNKWCVTV